MIKEVPKNTEVGYGGTFITTRRVCMDQFMVDVTDIDDIKRGDTVTLLDERLSVLWMADLLNTNVDEIVCGISKRVPRIYE